MLKGLSITPPVIGRISIGRVVEKHGKRLPEKDDQFTLTSQVQGRDGWVLHPLDETLRKGANGKLRAIPVRLLFNDPNLNLRAEYSLFDRETGGQSAWATAKPVSGWATTAWPRCPARHQTAVPSARLVAASPMGG